MNVKKLSIVLAVFALLVIQPATYAENSRASAGPIVQESEGAKPNSSAPNSSAPNSPEIEALIRHLNASDLDVKANSVKALVEIGPQAVGPLILALESEDPDIRENAACALGEIGDEKAIKPLIPLLTDEEWEVEYAANNALVAIGEPAIEPLILILQDDNESVYLQTKVIHVLGDLSDERAIHPMLQALKSGDPELRADLGSSLGSMGEAAVEPLILTLGDKDPYVRVRAAEALGKIGDERAIGPLTEALDDDFERVRTFAKIGLEKIEYKREHKNNTTVIATYGAVREFYIEDQRKEWLDQLHSITDGARNDMESYFYPAGPVISYGTSIENRIGVGILEGSDVNASTLDEIYGIFDREGRERGVDKVPLVFEYEEFAQEDVMLEEETEAPTEDVQSAESAEKSGALPGFRLMLTLLAVLMSSCIVNRH